ncbi:MAG: rhodanese-like domain-containing protein [Bacteroidales bacterium]
MKILSVIFLSAIFLSLFSCNSQSSRSAGQTFGNINASEALAVIEKNLTNEELVILDTRTMGEYNQGHIENSLFLDFSAKDFYTRVSALDKNKTYLVYCNSGRRSAITMDFMKKNGFNNAWNLEGGIIAWQRAGFTLVK